MNIAERLKAAAARVRLGWCQHELYDHEGGVCALGAVRVAFGFQADVFLDSRFVDTALQQDMYQALWLLRCTIGLNAEDDAATIAKWNNAPERTAEDVADALEFAALIAEQEAHAARSSAELVQA